MRSLFVGCWLLVVVCRAHNVPLTFQKARTFFNYGGGLFFKAFVRHFAGVFCVLLLYFAMGGQRVVYVRSTFLGPMTHGRLPWSKGLQSSG